MGTHPSELCTQMYACMLLTEKLLEAGTGFHLTSYPDRCRAPREEEGGVINDGVSSALFPALHTYPSNQRPTK